MNTLREISGMFFTGPGLIAQGLLAMTFGVLTRPRGRSVMDSVVAALNALALLVSIPGFLFHPVLAASDGRLPNIISLLSGFVFVSSGYFVLYALAGRPSTWKFVSGSQAVLWMTASIVLFIVVSGLLGLAT